MPQTTVITSEFCTVVIQNVVLAKLSNAVLPSRAATTAGASGGAARFKPASGLTSRSWSRTRRQGESWATVLG